MMHAMKRILALITLFAVAPAGALETLDVTDGWLVQPVRTKGVADKTAAIPPDEAPEAWQEGGRLAKKPPIAKGERGGNNEQADYACWFKRTLDVPASWRAASASSSSSTGATRSSS